MLAYKLVQVKGRFFKKRVSFSMNFPGGEVEYTIDWVKPNPGCGPLCVYDKNIFNHMNTTSGRYELWEVDYEPSCETQVWIDPDWKLNLSILPKGTILADFVRLVRRVRL